MIEKVDLWLKELNKIRYQLEKRYQQKRWSNNFYYNFKKGIFYENN